MKNKKWISLAAAVVLAVTALPMGVFAAKKDGEEEKLTKITLNEVAHSIFYAPQYVAIEEGYFAEEGLDLTLVTGFGADKVLTALISGEADIGFMGAEASIYAYQEGATDPAVNFAQLTQRAGNFLVAREEMPDFKWEDLKGKKVLGGRKGGMPEMVFEYILRKNGLDPQKDLTINQSIDFGSTAAAFTGDDSAAYTVEFEPSATILEKEGAGHVVDYAIRQRIQSMGGVGGRQRRRGPARAHARPLGSAHHRERPGRAERIGGWTTAPVASSPTSSTCTLTTTPRSRSRAWSTRA